MSLAEGSGRIAGIPGWMRRAGSMKARHPARSAKDQTRLEAAI